MSHARRTVVLVLTLIIVTPGGAQAGPDPAQTAESRSEILVGDPDGITRHELSFGGSGVDVTSLDTRRMLAPAVAIRFRLDRSQYLRLEILDRHGRLVRTLAQGLWAEGTHDLAWHQDGEDGQLVETGIYLVRLSDGDEDPEVEGLALAR